MSSEPSWLVVVHFNLAEHVSREEYCEFSRSCVKPILDNLTSVHHFWDGVESASAGTKSSLPSMIEIISITNPDSFLRDHQYDPARTLKEEWERLVRDVSLVFYRDWPILQW